MDIFQQIEGRFAHLDETQGAIIEALTLMHTKATSMREDIQALRGCFTSIEAMLIVNAAQMADFKTRLEAVERKQGAA